MGVVDYVRGLVNRERGGGDLVVENTGEATRSDGGAAVTGYCGPLPRRGRRIIAKNTGDATASGPGSQSVSGINWT